MAKKKKTLDPAPPCYLCGTPTRYNKQNLTAAAHGHLADAETHDLNAKSEMHYGHVTGKSRSREQFATISQAGWDKMGVKNKKGSVICCYECHEVLLHNIVLSELMLDQLRGLFPGMSFEERAVLLNKIFATGLNQITSDATTHSPNAIR